MGRVDIINNIDYSDYDQFKGSTTSFVDDALKSHVSKNDVSSLFFSEYNINLLQLGMQNMILNQTCGKYRIGKQSVNELLTIMRGIYLQYSNNIQINIKEQVRKLNEHVLNFAVPRIISELLMHDKYISDIKQNPIPMEYGLNTSVCGTKNSDSSKLYQGLG